MKKTIKVKTDFYFFMKEVEIEADVVDGFAVHPSTVGNGWTVTHVKSGLACGHPMDTKKKAVEQSKNMRKLCVDETRLADMEIWQAIEMFPSLYDQLQELIDARKDPEHRAEAMKRLQNTITLLGGKP